MVDNVNTLDMERDYLRQAYGMVRKSQRIFKGTIEENIAYGKAMLDEQRLLLLYKKPAHKFILWNNLEGYDTMIDEDGGNISQGQKYWFVFLPELC